MGSSQNQKASDTIEKTFDSYRRFIWVICKQHFNLANFFGWFFFIVAPSQKWSIIIIFIMVQVSCTIIGRSGRMWVKCFLDWKVSSYLYPKISTYSQCGFFLVLKWNNSLKLEVWSQIKYLASSPTPQWPVWPIMNPLWPYDL